MGRSEVKSSGVEKSDKKQGHYVAYRADGEVLWEKEDFVIGKDKVPAGVSQGMSACAIYDKNEKIISKWNPWAVVELS